MMLGFLGLLGIGLGLVVLGRLLVLLRVWGILVVLVFLGVGVLGGVFREEIGVCLWVGLIVCRGVL